MTVTLDQANRLIAAAFVKGAELKLAPLTVVVLDPGGHVVAVQRQDGSGILRVEVATGKAYGGLGLGFGSRELMERAAKTPAFVNALAVASNGRMVPVPGGVLITGPDGAVLGAVGISGDLSDNDEACAIAGIHAVGLLAKTGAGAPE